MKVTLDLRFVVVLLVLIIGGMLVLWHPWQDVGGKTITVSGEASVKAIPDEFIFNPTYQKKSASVTEAISEVSKLGNEVVAKIKEMGVADSTIKTNVTSNPDYSYEPLIERKPNDYSAQYSLTVTVNNKDVAKKILDYIATTPSLYGVSPQSTFTKSTQKKLETEARGKALADARSKADQTAAELNVRLGSVNSVTEGGGFGGPILLEGRGAVKPQIAQDQSLTPPVLQTGLEEINFSVSVVYQIR